MSGRPLASLFALTLLLMVSAAGTEAGLTETLLSGAGEFQTVERAIAEIPAGASEDLLALEGAGVLRALRFRLINSGGHLLRGAVLEMRWDGDPQPAVRVPLGDFFGLVRGRLEPLDTTFLKVRGERQGVFECAFPMPYGDGARIALVNESPVTLPSFFVVAEIAELAEPPELRFTAGWALSRPVRRGEGHPVLRADGPGLFAGAALDLVPGHPGPWDEARFHAEMDGRPVEADQREFLTLRSFIGQDWGVEPALSSPRRGSRLQEGGGASFHRFDPEFPARFDQGLDLQLFPYSDLSGPRRDEVVSVCYGYGARGTTFVQDLPPYAARIPRQPLAGWSPGFIDNGDLKVTEVSARDGVRNVAAGPFDLPYIGGDGWRFPFDEVGDFAQLTYPVRKNGNYLVRALLRQGPRGGRFAAEVDGRTVISGIETYAPGETLAIVTLDEVYLDEGPHRIGFRVEGKADVSEGYELVLDGIELREQEPEFVRKWLLIGPFVIDPPGPEGGLGAGYARAFPPEQVIDVDAEYDGGAGPVRWNWYAPGPSGFVDLYRDLPIPALHGVAYAVTHVESPSDRDAAVYFGSDDGATVWVNGRRVHDKPVTRSFAPDSDAFTVSLRKGWNTVLVKVGNAGGGWGFAMRMPAPKGTYEFQPYPPKE